ncbi:MAG: hypothetical protein WA208_00045 [Thermoanaerobaculia bacterium]
MRIPAIPALRERSEFYPARFEGRVPKRIRITARHGVTADPPLCYFAENRDLFVEGGKVYDAWTNSHGAVAAILANGKQLGLRPAEFEVVDWYDADDVLSAGRDGAR